jgi:hypothetical protein
MRKGQRFAVTTLAVVIAVILIVGSAPASDKKTNVQLTLKLDINGRLLMKVQPQNAKIWRNRPDKPKKVNWWTVNLTDYDELFWELRYEPSKGGGTVNYFGDVDIECGTTEIKVQPDKKPESPYAEWPYSVTVYACDDGAKAQQLAAVDPRIIWVD